MMNEKKEKRRRGEEENIRFNVMNRVLIYVFRKAEQSNIRSSCGGRGIHIFHKGNICLIHYTFISKSIVVHHALSFK
jgi:hypothetical protein